MKKMPKEDLIRVALELAGAFDQVGDLYPEHVTEFALLEEVISWETKNDVKKWFEESYCSIEELNKDLDEFGFSGITEFTEKDKEA